MDETKQLSRLAPVLKPWAPLAHLRPVCLRAMQGYLQDYDRLCRALRLYRDHLPDDLQSILGWLEGVTGTTSYYVTFTITFIIAMLIPIALLALTALVARRFNGDSLTQNFAKFGYAIIPLDVAGHVAHNLFHLLAEGKAVFYTGIALLGYEAQGVSSALLGSGAIQILQYSLVVLGVIGSLYTVYRIAGGNYGQGRTWSTFAPYAVLVLLLGAVNIWLFILPMAMRM